jgi:hypothetical protein
MRTYKTLSLSLPPDVVKKLERLGRADSNKTAARIAAEVVIRFTHDPTGFFRDRIQELEALCKKENAGE